MRLVYVDEAGISKPAQEPFLVVAAVVVDADKKLVAIERHLDKLVQKHIPEPHREGFIFHAHHLFNGSGKVFDAKNDPANPRWSPDRRMAVADDLVAILRKFDLPLAWSWTEKAHFPVHDEAKIHFNSQSKSQQIVITHVCTFMACALKIEHWMRKRAPNEVCMLIVEDNEQARSLIRGTQSYYQNKNIVPTLDARAKQYFPFKKIKEDPAFQAKRASSVLQLADFVAYVAKKYLMGDELFRQRFIAPIWDQQVDPDVPVPGQLS